MTFCHILWDLIVKIYHKKYQNDLGINLQQIMSILRYNNGKKKEVRIDKKYIKFVKNYRIFQVIHVFLLKSIISNVKRNKTYYKNLI